MQSLEKQIMSVFMKQLSQKIIWNDVIEFIASKEIEANLLFLASDSSVRSFILYWVPYLMDLAN